MCVCVCLLALSRLNGLTYGQFGTVIDLDDISDEFNGKGHRSKVKVTRPKKVISRVFLFE